MVIIFFLYLRELHLLQKQNNCFFLMFNFYFNCKENKYLLIILFNDGIYLFIIIKITSSLFEYVEKEQNVQ